MGHQSLRNNFARGVVLLIVGVSAVVTPIFAQQENDDRRQEEKKRLLVDNAIGRAIKAAQKWTWEYGGWLNYQFNDYSDSDNDHAAPDSLDYYQTTDLRWWLKGTYWQRETQRHHTFYLRLKNQYFNRDGVSPGDKYDLKGPLVDYAYGIVDFKPWKVEVGRKYYLIGKGIAYSDVHDGARVHFIKPFGYVNGFISHTLPHETNIDISVPGALKESERYFYGINLGYTGILSQEFYTYYILQRDMSDESPENFSREYMYDSEYAGLGARGLISEKWNYSAELIYQTGEGRISSTNEVSPVRAWGGDVEVSFEPETKHYPVFSVEYAFGSGDAERSSVTDTVGGNLTGRDTNFLYFGYLSTGFAMAPRLSNLHMIRAGADWTPFPSSMWLKRLTMSLDYYRFFKHKSTGAISDSEASLDENDVGSEVDIGFEWKVFSDLTASFEFGHFMPGDAYLDSSDTAEDFISLSLTHTF